MEIIMLIMAAAYAVGSKNHKDTSTAAYKAGKEPPGLAKARMRHEAGGGRFVTRPGKTDQPKGPGATRLLIAQKWANGCEKSRTRSEDELRRWQAWYQEQAPQRDENWRAKQRRKINNRAERLAKWQGRWVSAKTTLAGGGGQDSAEANTGSDTEQEPASAEGETQPGVQDQTEQAVEDSASSGENTQTDDTEPAKQSEQGQNTSTGGGSPAAGSSTAPIGDLVDYQQAVATLHNHADEIEGFNTALSGLGQDMDAAGWGSEVHGDLGDMHSQLASITARYRDLAEDVKAQGDAVNDAYDNAPWAPDKAALTR